MSHPTMESEAIDKLINEARNRVISAQTSVAVAQDAYDTAESNLCASVNELKDALNHLQTMEEMSNGMQGDFSGAGTGTGVGAGCSSSHSCSQRGIQDSVSGSDYYAEMTGGAVARTMNEDSMDVVGEDDTNVGNQNESMIDHQHIIDTNYNNNNTTNNQLSILNKRNNHQQEKEEANNANDFRHDHSDAHTCGVGGNSGAVGSGIGIEAGMSDDAQASLPDEIKATTGMEPMDTTHTETTKKTPTTTTNNSNDDCDIDDAVVKSKKKRKPGKKIYCNVEGCTSLVRKAHVCWKHGASATSVIKMCSAEGCKSHVQNMGLCIKHGARLCRKICNLDGCTNQVVTGGVCWSHGGKDSCKRCSHEGCNKIALKGGVCIRHGSTVFRKKCSHYRCVHYARKGGVCGTHGGGKDYWRTGDPTAGHSTASHVPSSSCADGPSLAILARGENGAVDEMILKGMAFTVTGLFEEVHEDSAAATAAVKRMIQSFGGKVLESFSKNTSKCPIVYGERSLLSRSPDSNSCLATAYLLAGKNAASGKIKDAMKRSVEVINLRRLQKLLLGHLTFDEMKELRKLTRNSFVGDAYEPGFILHNHLES
mmetsp:Transcript_12474/g.23758  ORF Transcript_12474/g.23758 Transcript_12474/m.23758 type:complete len:594 (+) Transcript_12474:114-1895(+)